MCPTYVHWTITAIAYYNSFMTNNTTENAIFCVIRQWVNKNSRSILLHFLPFTHIFRRLNNTHRKTLLLFYTLCLTSRVTSYMDAACLWQDFRFALRVRIQSCCYVLIITLQRDDLSGILRVVIPYGLRLG